MKGPLVDLLEAIILGIVQGATEFLPVSSSGHLVLVPWWLGFDKPPLLFDVVVHLGTLMAVLVYFWRDWLTLVLAGFNALRNRTLQDPDARLLLLLAIGTIPAAIAGVLLDDVFEAAFAEPRAAALALLVTAGLLAMSERVYASTRTLSDINLSDTLLIGVAQAFAIFPGISRSGSTIAAGMLRGLPRPAAARFSFLLATPIIIGAGLKQAFDVLTGSVTLADDLVGPLIVGFLAAAVVGFVSIWFLMRLLQSKRLYGFAVYCAAFGTLSLLVALFV